MTDHELATMLIAFAPQLTPTDALARVHAARAVMGREVPKPKAGRAYRKPEAYDESVLAFLRTCTYRPRITQICEAIPGTKMNVIAAVRRLEAAGKIVDVLGGLPGSRGACFGIVGFPGHGV